jgi:ABC-type branched-subunit amino acid transport system substrate-binding protein
MDTVVGSNMVSEPLFASLGDKVIGFYNDVRYSPLIDTPENKKFVEAWRAKRSEDLYYLTGGNYNAMQILFQGIEKAGSSDPDAVREALSGAEVSTLYGPATIRPEDQQLLIPTYLGQVAQDAGGELHFRLAATVPASKTTPSPSPLCDIDAEAA